MHATFLAKPMTEEAGSALHIHQSVIDKNGDNIFSTGKGEPSDHFQGFLGGLQTYMPQAMLMFCAVRQFLSPLSQSVVVACEFILGRG